MNRLGNDRVVLPRPICVQSAWLAIGLPGEPSRGWMYALSFKLS